jgi:hypothetical protein
VLGFYHLAESGITADVLGRHLTVETDRIKNIFHIEAIFLTAHKEDFSMEAESKQVPPSFPQYSGVYHRERI